MFTREFQVKNQNRFGANPMFCDKLPELNSRGHGLSLMIENLVYYAFTASKHNIDKPRRA